MKRIMRERANSRLSGALNVQRGVAVCQQIKAVTFQIKVEFLHVVCRLLTRVKGGGA